MNKPSCNKYNKNGCDKNKNIPQTKHSHNTHSHDTLREMMELKKAVCKIDKLSRAFIRSRKEDQKYYESVEQGIRKDLEYEKKLADLEYDQNSNVARLNNEAAKKIIQIQAKNAEDLLNMQKAHVEATKMLTTEKIKKEFESSMHRTNQLSKWNTELSKECQDHIRTCKSGHNCRSTGPCKFHPA